jgi:hypothetical protein
MDFKNKEYAKETARAYEGLSYEYQQVGASFLIAEMLGRLIDTLQRNDELNVKLRK